MTPGAPACPVCASDGAFPVVDLASVPVFCNVLCPTRDEALATARGRIDLHCCPSCAMLFNAAFDESRLEYTGRYENALHFSPLFRAYAEDLTRSLAERHALAGKNIVEIGCGDASFLGRLCEITGARGLGIDPAHDTERAGSPPANVRVVAQHYDERLARDFPADLIVSRHVLEHIPEPRAFLSSVRGLLSHGSSVYFEVPNALWTIEQLGVWDLIYEHCSYFTAPAIGRLFRDAGFRVDSAEPAYAGQFLGVHATADDPSTSVAAEEVKRVVELARGFASRFEDKADEWERTLDGIARAEGRVALWGAGSKGVTFLNIMHERLGGTRVTHAVDRNPRKHGMHIAGVGTPIVAPEALREAAPSHVIVMNPTYRDEIASELGDLGVETEIIVA